MDPGSTTQLKVSAHDRVSSMIVAMLYMLGFVVFLLFMVWVTTRKSTATQLMEVEYLDELPGGDTALSDGRDFEEPSVEDMQDLVSADTTELLEAVTDVASVVAGGDEAPSGNSYESRSGESRRAGEGGNASVPRWERWEVRFTTTSLGGYATQLESFGIELAAVGGGSDEIAYARGLDQGTPSKRMGKSDAEKRLYMSYRSGQLKEFDRQLLAKAGIPTGGRMMLQFYPPQVENLLATLEKNAAGGRPLKDIRKTVFGVRQRGAGFTFEVVEQRFR